MLSTAGEQDSDTLWLQDKHGTQNECVTGAAAGGIGNVSAVAAIIFQEVQRLSNVDLVGFSVWEKYEMFNVVVSYNKKLVTFPRERDQ